MNKSIQKRAKTLVDELPFLMRFFHRFSHTVLHKAELTLPQFQTLSAFTLKDQWNLTDLSDYLQVKLPAASELVDRLVKSKLLSRKTNELDRRQTIITLTKKGKLFLRRRHKQLLVGYERLLKELSATDQKRLEHAFAELYQIALNYTQKGIRQ